MCVCSIAVRRTGSIERQWDPDVDSHTASGKLL